MAEIVGVGDGVFSSLLKHQKITDPLTTASKAGMAGWSSSSNAAASSGR